LKETHTTKFSLKATPITTIYGQHKSLAVMLTDSQPKVSCRLPNIVIMQFMFVTFTELQPNTPPFNVIAKISKKCPMLHSWQGM
jgi:hypothetical protein